MQFMKLYKDTCVMSVCHVFRTTEREYTVVVEQLESERQEASKRSQKLQEKLSGLQNERDSALKKGSEYKAKLAEVKEGCRKEITNLQARLAKVCIYECRVCPVHSRALGVQGIWHKSGGVTGTFS